MNTDILIRKYANTTQLTKFKPELLLYIRKIGLDLLCNKWFCEQSSQGTIYKFENKKQ